MVIHNDKLNKKEQKQEIQGKEKTRQKETQRMVRSKIKETVQKERRYDTSQGDKSNVGNRKEEETKQKKGRMGDHV